MIEHIKAVESNGQHVIITDGRYKGAVEKRIVHMKKERMFLDLSAIG